MVYRSYGFAVMHLVGEHSTVGEAGAASDCGDCRKANVGISNDKAGEKPAHRKTKVS